IEKLGTVDQIVSEQKHTRAVTGQVRTGTHGDSHGRLSQGRIRAQHPSSPHAPTRCSCAGCGSDVPHAWPRVAHHTPCIIGAVLHASRRTRGLLVWLFLCALICAQSASFASEHSHRHASQHCCRLCHVGPLPLLQPVTSAGLAPVVAVAWLSLSCDFDTPHEALLTAGSSRAPPFSLPV